jgi:hypothetical protein
MRSYWTYNDIEFDDEEFENLEDYLRSNEFELCEDPEEYGDFRIDNEEEIK